MPASDGQRAMIDPEIEKLLNLEQAAKLPWLPRPRCGKKIATSSLWRWCVQGVGGVKLDSLFLGGRIYTSPAALKRFMQAVQPRPLRANSPRRNPRHEFPSDQRITTGPAQAELLADRMGL
jgi:hypothetical protein